MGRVLIDMDEKLGGCRPTDGNTREEVESSNEG